MSASLAIAAVTAVLQHILRSNLTSRTELSSLGDVNVTALPPDRISTGADEPNQLNVFLYRIAPYTRVPKDNSATRAEQTASHSARPRRLALELSYLLTAYGAQDLHAELLLGHVVHSLSHAQELFHARETSDTPVQAEDHKRTIIRSALKTGSPKKGKTQLSPLQTSLASPDLFERLQQIKITLQFIGFEEMAKIWSVLQARYRPSIVCEISAVIVNEGV